MKLRASIHQQDETGKLWMIDKGECQIYSPDCNGFKVHDPYVSINFGKYRIHLNKQDFTEFCKKFLYDRSGGNVPLLR
jgi:hypothetical protein